MKIKQCALALAFSVPLIVSPLNASELAGSGDILAMLQKIQGQWRTICQQADAGKKSFSITKLSISFTHFLFVTTSYKDGRCVSVKKVTEEKYSFALRGAKEFVAGRPVFAIDFKPAESFGAEGGLYPSNIIRYENGKLLLGDHLRAKQGERLTRLNRSVEFVH